MLVVTVEVEVVEVVIVIGVVGVVEVVGCISFVVHLWETCGRS